MKKLFKLWKIRLLAFLIPDPQVKEEYITKMVFLLRRDFDTATQNEIIISITRKLAEAREQDMNNMAKQYDIIQKDLVKLRQVLLC